MIRRLVQTIVFCLVAAAVASASPAGRVSVQTAPASCQPGKGGICIVFNGRIKGSEKSPRLFATSVDTTIRWHLVWVTSKPGYGVPDLLEKSSTVGGKAVVMLQASPTRCPTTFELSQSNPPLLVAGASGTASLVIKIPNPASVSSGDGSGFPSIQVANPDCAAGLMSTRPVAYSVVVPLHPTTIRRSVIGFGRYDNPAQGKKGAAHMSGTITVTVG